MARAQRVRQFDPPHPPVLLATTERDNREQRYRYRGFQFRVWRGRGNFFFWRERWYCPSFEWIGAATSYNYTYGGPSGNEQRLMRKMMSEIDKKIDADIARQELGDDTWYCSIEEWFATEPKLG